MFPTCPTPSDSTGEKKKLAVNQLQNRANSIPDSYGRRKDPPIILPDRGTSSCPDGLKEKFSKNRSRQSPNL